MKQALPAFAVNKCLGIRHSGCAEAARVLRYAQWEERWP
jgi:hypothetical protein